MLVELFGRSKPRRNGPRPSKGASRTFTEGDDARIPHHVIGELLVHGVAFCLAAAAGSLILWHFYWFFAWNTDGPSAARGQLRLAHARFRQAGQRETHRRRDDLYQIAYGTLAWSAAAGTIRRNRSLHGPHRDCSFRTKICCPSGFTTKFWRPGDTPRPRCQRSGRILSVSVRPYPLFLPKNLP